MLCLQQRALSSCLARPILQDPGTWHRCSLVCNRTHESWLLRRFLSDELLGTLGNVYKSAARLMSELTQRGADDCHGYWMRTQEKHPNIEQLLLDKVRLCLQSPCFSMHVVQWHTASPCQHVWIQWQANTHATVRTAMQIYTPASRSASMQSLHAAPCPMPPGSCVACLQMAAVDDSSDMASKAPVGSPSVERVSFLPVPAAAESPAPGPAKAVNGNAGGEGPTEKALPKPPLAAKIQKEVSAPLAGVQTALIMDVPLWEHTKTFRSLSHGLYVMPKARCRLACLNIRQFSCLPA